MTNAAGRTYVSLGIGDPAPWFTQRVTETPTFQFHKSAGRYIVLCFVLSAGDDAGRDTMAAIASHCALFDDEKVRLFSISIDSADESTGRARDIPPGVHLVWDFDRSVSSLYGAVPRDRPASEGKFTARRFWLVLDPRLRVLKVVPFAADGSDRETVFAFVRTLPPLDRYCGFELQAPILYLPDVFERALCNNLIELYEKNGGTESGFMREVDGRTVTVSDPKHKRRKDYNIEDIALIDQIKARIARRVVPEIAKAHQFQITRMERFIVACYAAEDGGHFDAHRDNTTKGTAHRRFAVSLNLNDDYDGGEIRFPEYGPRGFKPAPGAAVVFSCSLLHAASLVTRGRRYVFLPFLYDEAAAAIREKNNQYLDPTIGQYRSG